MVDSEVGGSGGGGERIIWRMTESSFLSSDGKERTISRKEKGEFSSRNPRSSTTRLGLDFGLLPPRTAQKGETLGTH